MYDKNGAELKTGSVVRISGAYFKNDNGLWFVTAAPGDPGWGGSDVALCRVGVTGKVSASKYRVGFWPLSTFTNSRALRLEANAWNRENAEIEVVPDAVRNMDGIRAYFLERRAEAQDRLDWSVRRFGSDCEDAERDRALIAHLDAVLARLPAAEATA